jgi:hypothetical protein
MRIAADGYIDISDGRRVRTPGYHQQDREPVPEAQAISFLLSHSFPGHRRLIRSLTIAERKTLRLALWADSVSERMAIVDRIWRGITEPVASPTDPSPPKLVQVVQLGAWAYPVHLDGRVTRVIPLGGMPAAEVDQDKTVLDLDRKTA